MERYGVIYGTDSLGEYGQMAISDEIRDLVERAGTPYPMEAVEAAQKLMSGFDLLPGWEAQPKKNKPVSVRYSALKLANRFDMPGNMKPLYALSVSGMGIRLGYKKYAYSGMVLIDRRELLPQRGMNYVDQIFGTHLLGDDEMERVRQGMGKIDPNLKPTAVSPRLMEEDLPTVVTIAAELFAGKNVAVRLEQGYVFNQRSLELLAQVYSLLPPQKAIETGFATYPQTPKIKDAIADAGISLFVVPAEAEIGTSPAGCTVIDLEDGRKYPSGNLAVCLRRWAQLPWQDRYQAMLKVFGGAGAAGPTAEEYVAKSIKFFSDPIFKFNPTTGKCPTLEALKAEYDRYPALRMDLEYLDNLFRKGIPVLMGSEAVFPQQKAQTAALARTARTAEERQKYTVLYRFAQKLNPEDASLHAIVQTEKLVEEKLREETAEKLQAAEQATAEALAQAQATAEQRMSKALADQKADYENQLSRQEQSAKNKLSDALARKDQDCAARITELQSKHKAAEAALTADKQRSEANLKQVSTELQKLKEDHAAKVKKLTGDHAAEKAKLQSAHAEELKQARSAAQSAAVTVAAADAKKQKQEHEAQISRLKQEYEVQLTQLKKLHAEELEKAKAAGRSNAAASSGQAQNATELKKLKEANLAELNRLKAAHTAEITRLKSEHEAKLRDQKAQYERMLAARSSGQASGQSGSAQAVSDKAKQMMATQLLRNLRELEQLKARHQAELAAARKQ